MGDPQKSEIWKTTVFWTVMSVSILARPEIPLAKLMRQNLKFWGFF